MVKILVIDDDENFLRSIKKTLYIHNYEADTLSNPAMVAKAINKEKYQAVLSDVKMPGINGLEVLDIVHQSFPSLPVLMISGQSDIKIAVDCIRKGAFDFIEKPVDPERMLVAVRNALSKSNLEDEKENIYNELADKYKIIGDSPGIKAVINTIQNVADTQARVLITGESGTGKELVAWALHHNSRRTGKPYLKVNCAAIPGHLLESELFGHKKGAFTGALNDHKGKFLAANGGTLFLDEIGDMDLAMQAKLLRVLQENEVEMIGDPFPKKIDVRILAATNQDLSKLIEQGKFREDLFHRLNVINIHIPRLAQRKDDIIPLAYHFLRTFNESYNKQVLKINQRAESLLLNYNWPGNVRELRNIVEKLVIFSNGPEIQFAEVSEAFGNKTENNQLSQNPSVEAITDLATALQNFEKNYIARALKDFEWKKIETAKALNIDRSNLFRKMRKFGIKEE